MRMTKKITSVVLVVLMVVSMMSVMAISASASEYKASVNGTSYTSFTDALQAAADNDTILLLDNVNINSEITIDKKITLDINEFTFSGDVINVASNKQLNVKSGTLSAQIYVEDGAVLSLDPTAILTLTSERDFITVRNGTVHVRGSITANNNSPAIYIPGGYSNSVVSVGESTIRGKHAIYMDDGTANIQGGNFDGNMAVCVKGGTVNISGGTFTNNALYVESGTVQVSGGKFSEEVNPQYLLNGYSCIENDDGTYSVGICVARVGNARFTDINDAVSAAQDGDTIVLLNNVNLTDVLYINNKKLTLDLNGKWMGDKRISFVHSDITVMDSSANKNGKIGNGVTVSASKFTLNSGTICESRKAIEYYDYSGSCEITINGGTVYTYNAQCQVFGPSVSNDYNKDIIVINGGKFYATSSSNTAWGSMLSHNSKDYLYINGGDFSQQGIANSIYLIGFTLGGNTFITGGKFPQYRYLNQGAAYGTAYNGPLPASSCAKGYEPTEKIDGYYYTVQLKDNPLDDFETSADDAKTADKNKFQLEGNYNAGALLGVQMKTKESVNAPETSEGHQETSKDLRFIAALDTALLNKAEDYGFVVAQTDAFDGNIEKKVDNTNFSRVSKGNVKTISAKGTYNNVCGNVAYGDPYDYSTNYKYITFAVNDIPDGKKIVTRFYVTIDGKTYYAKYAKDNYAGGYTGCIAGINAGSVY